MQARLGGSCLRSSFPPRREFFWPLEEPSLPSGRADKHKQHSEARARASGLVRRNAAPLSTARDLPDSPPHGDAGVEGQMGPFAAFTSRSVVRSASLVRVALRTEETAAEGEISPWEKLPRWASLRRNRGRGGHPGMWHLPDKVRHLLLRSLGSSGFVSVSVFVCLGCDSHFALYYWRGPKVESSKQEGGGGEL